MGSGTVSSTLPRWKSHKEVHAVKIVAIVFDADQAKTAHRETDGSAQLLPDAGPAIIVGPQYLKKHQPHAGGYYVLYADGYESFSPAAAFESGYTRAEA